MAITGSLTEFKKLSQVADNMHNMGYLQYNERAEGV